VDDRDRRGVVGPPIELAHAHAAQPHGGDLQALAQDSMLHVTPRDVATGGPPSTYAVCPPDGTGMDNGVMSFFRSRKVLVTVAIVAIVTMSMSMVVMFM
jgi:hypothetical protein